MFYLVYLIINIIQGETWWVRILFVFFNATVPDASDIRAFVLMPIWKCSLYVVHFNGGNLACACLLRYICRAFLLLLVRTCSLCS